MGEVSVSHRGRKKIFCFFWILFYRGAFCYFQEAKLFCYIFLKTCAVMCEVIQLLYSNDQYSFNGQMHTGIGSRKKIFCFFCILFYREAFCYFQEAKLFHYIFLKTCAVMCEVIQLLYSNDQYPFNGQMHTGTGSALVFIIVKRNTILNQLILCHTNK